MSFLLLSVAAIVYAVGGLFMKTSAGAVRVLPTLTFVTLFVVGSLVQARGMRDVELSAGYVIVLGLEAVAAVLLGALLLHEGLSASRLLATALIIAGVAWLRAT